MIGASGGVNEGFFNVAIQTPVECADLFETSPSNDPTYQDNLIIENIETLANLDQYEEGVVEYICGFVGKSVAINQKCDSCFRLILKQNKKTDSLISQKEVYCLLHPRKEIVEIGSKCEKKYDKKRFSSKRMF